MDKTTVYLRMQHILIWVAILITFSAKAQTPKLILPAGHTDWVSATHYSPDGKLVATGSYDKSIKLWELSTGHLIYTLMHNDVISDVTFSPDSNYISSCSFDKTIRIWDVKTGLLIHNMPDANRYPQACTFSKDSRLLVSTGDLFINVWDVKKGVLVTRIPEQPYSRIFILPDNKSILCKSRNKIELIDITSGRIIHSLDGAETEVKEICITTDGRHFSTGTANGFMYIYETSTFSLMLNMRVANAEIQYCQYSPDQSQLAIAYNGIVEIRSTDSFQLKFTLKTFGKNISNIIYDTSGSHSIGVNYDKNKVAIWNAQDGSLLSKWEGRLKLNNKVYLMMSEFAKDGKSLLFSDGYGSASTWNISSGRMIQRFWGHSSDVSVISYNPETALFYTFSKDGFCRVWDVRSGKLIKLIGNGHADWAVFSKNGKYVALSSRDSDSLQIWDLSSNEFLFPIKTNLKETGIYVSFGTNNKYVFVRLAAGSAGVWDLDNGRQVMQLDQPGRIEDAKFSPDGMRLVTVGWNDSITIWSVTTGQRLNTFRKYGYNIYSADFDTTGLLLISNVSDKRYTIEEGIIWDAATGAVKYELKGHSEGLYQAEFDGSGKYAITTSRDVSIIWDVVTGIPLCRLYGDGALDYATLTKDRKFVVTHSYPGSVKVWELSTCQPIASYKGDQFAFDDAFKYSFISDNHKLSLYNNTSKNLLYNIFSLDSADYLTTDEAGRFDGTRDARKLLYFTCGTEIVELDQVKDQLWVPSLARRVVNGDDIQNMTLNELNICGLTPLVETIADYKDGYHFHITPRRGGLKEMIVSVNGIETKRYKPSQAIRIRSGYDLFLRNDSLKRYFVAGQNNPVTLKATTAINEISSRSATVSESTLGLDSTYPNLYGIMVGVNDYKDADLHLNYPAKDARALSTIVSLSARKFLNAVDAKEHVFMYNLTTDSNYYSYPEKKAIKKVFHNVGMEAKANDILLIFFAGHGKMEPASGKFYFLTADASNETIATNAIKDVGISMTELMTWIQPDSIKAQKRLLIFDACYSGKAIGEIVKAGENGNIVVARGGGDGELKKVIEDLNSKSGLYILAAAAGNQEAYEMSLYSQGILTYSLLSVIKQLPEKVLDNNKYLSVSPWFGEAEKKVKVIVSNEGKTQEPQLSRGAEMYIGEVDGEVISRISLGNDRFMFGRSEIRNEDTRVDDNGLNKLLSNELQVRSNEDGSKIVFNKNFSGDNSYNIGGDYKIRGNKITASIVLLEKGGTRGLNAGKIEGSLDQLPKLVKDIVSACLSLIVSNNGQ